MSRNAFFFAACVALIFGLGLAWNGSTQHSLNGDKKKSNKKPPIPPQPKSTTSTKKAKTRSIQKNILALQETLNFSSGIEMQFKLSEATDLLHEILQAKGHELPIFIREDYFRFEYPHGPRITDEIIKVPTKFKKVTGQEILTEILEQVSTLNATFIVKRKGIVITTKSRATNIVQLQEKVLSSYRDQPLGEVIQDISEQIGFPYLVDDQVLQSMKKPITVSFNHSVSAESALILLAQKGGIGVFVDKEGVFFTTKEESSKLKEALLKRMEFVKEMQGSKSPKEDSSRSLQKPYFDGQRWVVPFLTIPPTNDGLDFGEIDQILSK